MIRTRTALSALLANLLWLTLPRDHPFRPAVSRLCDGLRHERRAQRVFGL